MEKNNRILLKIFRNNSNHIPFLILGIVMLIFHFTIPTDIGDDILFKGVPLSYINNWSSFTWRYFNWSSRIIIEFFVILMLNSPKIIWQFLDSSVIVFLGIIISNLVANDESKIENWLVIFLILAYPLNELSGAGWVTTTVNYLWPFTFGLFSLTIIKKILNSEAISHFYYVISVPLLIIAVNNELLCVAFLLAFIASAVFMKIKKKKIHWFIILCIGLCLASSIFILTSPGNALRREAELSWFPDFNHLSFLQKIEISISSTLAHYIYKFNLIFILFCYLLFMSIKHKYSDLFFRTIASMPLIATIFFGVLLKFNPIFYHNVVKISDQMSKYGLVTLENFDKLSSYISLIILYFTALIILILLYLIYENSLLWVVSVVALIIGFLSRMILVFTPTIWVSGPRTQIVLYFSIIICSVFLFQNLKKIITKEFQLNIVIIYGIAASFSFLDLMMTF